MNKKDSCSGTLKEKGFCGWDDLFQVISVLP
jgi:hypothetical protein